MIVGPLAPTRFLPSSTKAPEPDLTVNPEWTTGQMLQCLQTGRIWVVGAANGTTTKQIRQVLPWVRQIATTPTTGTQMVNDGGQMKIQKDPSTPFGQFNMFNALKVDSDGNIQIPTYTGIPYFDASGFLSACLPVSFIVEDSDEVLTTSSANPTVFYHVNQETGGWIGPTNPGNHLITTTRQFYHNNSYTVHMAIEFTPNIPLGGTTFYPLIYHTITSPPGGGYTSMTLSAIASMGGGTGWIRVCAWSPETGVVHRPYSGVNQWRSNPTSPSAGYVEQSRSCMQAIQIQ